MAAESGVERARRFHAKADAAQRDVDKYRRMALACEKGAAGEQEIARLLDVLDGAGWHVLNDRYKAPGSPVNIDHIVIGPPGVLVVDAKNWSGGPVALDERGMSHRGHRRDKELESVVGAAGAVGAHARQACGTAVTVPALAFLGDAGPLEPVFHRQVMILRADRLLSWLTSLPRNLTAQQVHLLASTLDAALPPRTGPSRAFTVSSIGSTLPRQTLQRRLQSRTGGVRPGRATATTRPLRSGRQKRTTPQGGGQVLLRLAFGLFLLLFVLPALFQSVGDGRAASPMDRPAEPSPTTPSSNVRTSAPG